MSRAKMVWNLVATTAGIATVITLAGCGVNHDGHSGSVELASNVKSEGKSSGGEAITLPVVVAKKETLDRKIDLPGELVAFQDVPIYAKVEGFVQWLGVDRGSRVKKGETIIKIMAPELDAKVQEAASKSASADSGYQEAKSKELSARAAVREAQAKLDADSATLRRLQKAGQTPGVISDNELEVASKLVQADIEHVHSLTDAVAAAKSMVLASQENLRAAKDAQASLEATRQYLIVRAPFDGMITTRNVNVGSLVAPTEPTKAMVTLQELHHLRLVIPVPEIAVSGIQVGKQVSFSVPAYPDRIFTGTLARVSHALDQVTRTMPVELDVYNEPGQPQLTPGMFPQVHWQTERPYETVFLPSSAVGTDMEETFVIKVHDGVAQRVKVTRGQPMGNQVEVFGDIHPGDTCAVRASDDLKSGTKVAMHMATDEDLAKANQASSGAE